MKHWRLRTKLTFWSALASGFALLTLGLVAAINVYREEIQEIDRRLATNANLLFSEIASAPNGDWSSSDHSAQFLKNADSLYGFVISRAGGPVAHVYPDKLAPLAQTWPPAEKFSFAHLEK